MKCYYDLEYCPPTFDVVSFLMRIERERIKRGEASVSIEILPGPRGGFRADVLWPQSIEVRRQLLYRVVVPMCRMLPSCTDVVVCDERPDKPEPGSFGFRDYTMHFKYFVDAIAEGIRPLRAPKWAQHDSRVVTMTLREAEHWPARNSRVAEWAEAARRIAKLGFRVVIVRDTVAAAEPLEGLEINPAAARNLEDRADLYASARCNMFVNNGPAWFAMALNARTLIIRPATEGVGKHYGGAWFARFGILTGSQMPGAPPHQRLAWEDDTAENIVEAFREFVWPTREEHRREAADAICGPVATPAPGIPVLG